MRENGFRVFPPIRLGLVLQKDIAVPATTNRFLLSLMLSLEEAQSTSRRRLGLDELLGVNLEDYFNEIAPSDHSSLFIFDQFEEILTIDSAQRAPKQEFFDQVGRALHNRERWALFAMREEYVAGALPYARSIP